MLAGPRPRIVTLLSVLPEADKSATLINLGASLAGAGSAVLVLDAQPHAAGVSGRLGGTPRASLAQIARRERALEDALRLTEQGFRLAMLTSGPRTSIHRTHGLEQAFSALAQQADIILVDAVLDEENALPLEAFAAGDVVIQVAPGADSITAGYGLIKRLNAALGRRPFGVLVSGASEQQAQLVFHNMEQAASRYLALQLHSVGSVPLDEHIKRASGLGRSVIDAFPLAGASLAFRRLAGRLALSELPLGNCGMLANGVNSGT